MKLDWETVKKMRALYLEGVEAREIDDRFGYRGSISVVRNRTWHDPAYEPPPPRRGGRRKALTIFGETKSLTEWSGDPRCRVSLETLRKRASEGWPEETILFKKSNAGRPRASG